MKVDEKLDPNLPGALFQFGYKFPTFPRVSGQEGESNLRDVALNPSLRSLHLTQSDDLTARFNTTHHHLPCGLSIDATLDPKPFLFKADLGDCPNFEPSLEAILPFVMPLLQPLDPYPLNVKHVVQIQA